MSKDNKKNEPKEEVSSNDFVIERIKERPINKKKLTRKMLFTASMAVVFGCVACLSFLLLEPFLEKALVRINQEDTVPPQVILEEAAADQDQVEVKAVINADPFEEADGMTVEETPIENLNYEDSSSDNSASSNMIINNVYTQVELDDYQMLYRKMYSLSKEVSKSAVIITSARKGQDILNEEYINTRRTIGLIIAENSGKVIILADSTEITGENFTVTFCDGYIAEAKLYKVDSETGLGIYTVTISSLPSATQNSYTIATLGNSEAYTVLGSPVIALGDPLNTGASVCYGAVTSIDTKIYGVDSGYQIINTDIYASRNGKGILVNVRGQVIGIICQHNNNGEMGNLITAYGMSGITSLIEDMSNNSERKYIGLNLKDIPDDVRKSYEIPKGVYVTKVQIDSPAMMVGLGSGDIICSIDDIEVNSVKEYMEAIRSKRINQNVKIGVMRLNGNEYYKTEIILKIAQREEGDK